MKLVHKPLIALIFTLLSHQTLAADNIATVNGKPIKQSMLDFIIKDETARGQKIDDNAKNIITQKLISSEILIQEAQRLGLDKQADYQFKEEFLRRELLANAFISDYLKKNPISEADIKAEYEAGKKLLGDKQYRASHILVSTESEAKDIIAQLNKNGDFAKIAKEKSKDTGSKEKGGDLDWFSPAAMVKPFADAITTMTKGAVSGPIQTQFGWHVIKLVDSRPMQLPAFDKVKDNIKQKLHQRKLETVMLDLREKAKIDIPKK